MRRTSICELLGVEYPVIQAPMNWITCAELAAAVSSAGGLGVLGPNAGQRIETNDVIETGDRLRREIRKVRSLTAKPFGVNLMTSFADHADNSRAFSEQCLAVLVEEEVPVAILAGSRPKEYTERLKDKGIRVVYRPLRPSPEAAVEAEAAGVDAFIAVGFEAGGHAGHDCIPTFVLIPEIVDTVRIPVIAGGGIVDGRGAAAALCLGAQGVFMGTRFIATTECTAHQNVKEAILAAGACNTTTVGGTVGTLRALKTPLIERCIDLESRGGSLRDISDLYRPGYAKGMIHGDVRDGVFVCGAGVGLIKEIVSAADVLRDVVKEAEQVMARVLMSEAREGGFEGSTGW